MVLHPHPKCGEDASVPTAHRCTCYQQLGSEVREARKKLTFGPWAGDSTHPLIQASQHEVSYFIPISDKEAEGGRCWVTLTDTAGALWHFSLSCMQQVSSDSPQADSIPYQDVVSGTSLVAQ